MIILTHYNDEIKIYASIFILVHSSIIQAPFWLPGFREVVHGSGACKTSKSSIEYFFEDFYYHFSVAMSEILFATSCSRTYLVFFFWYV